MKKFKKVEGSKIPLRKYAITCGLQEGYGPTGVLHTLEQGIQVVEAWMKERAAAGLPFLTGTVSSGTVIYAWPEGEGKAGSGNEPCVTFSGEVSMYVDNLSNQEIEEILDDLGTNLGSAMGQTRLYLSLHTYEGINTGRDYILSSKSFAWVIQAEETQTPTGEEV